MASTGDETSWTEEYDLNYTKSTDEIIYEKFPESAGYRVEAVPTDNGTGYIVTRNGGSVIIPPNSQDTNTVAYFVPGLNGHGNTLYGYNKEGPQFITNAKNGDFPPYTVVLTQSDLYNSRTRESGGVELLNAAYDAVTENGAKIENLGGFGFSNGTYGCMWTADKFLKDHPDANVETRIYLADQYNSDQVFKHYGGEYDRTSLSSIGGNQLSTLNDQNVEIVMSYRNEDNHIDPKNPELNGHNGHKDPQLMDAVAMGMLGFNITLAQRSKGEHFDCFTDFFTGNWGLAYFAGAFEQEDQKPEAVKLADYNMDLLKMPSYGVSANTKYVYDEMNNVRTQVKEVANSNEVTFQANSFPQLGNLPSITSKITGCIELYNNMMDGLLSNLLKETEVICSVAVLIDAMESDLDKGANTV